MKRRTTVIMPTTSIESAADRRQRGLRLARRIYVPRTLGLILGGTSIGCVLYEQSAPSWVWAPWVTQIALWSHIAYWRSCHHSSPYHAEYQNLSIDSLLGGFWLAAMHFNLLPSVLVATMISLDNIAVGGVRLLGRGLGLLAAGALAGTWLVGRAFPAIAPSAQVLLGCLPMLVIYPLAIGYITYRQARQLSRQKRILTVLSRTDGLTGLANRRHWEAQVAACVLGGPPAVIALLDIDHFKAINDEYGHGRGDEILRRIAELLREAFDDTVMLGRYGGEEFGVLLPGVSMEKAVDSMKQWQRCLRFAAAPAPLTRMPTCSLGLAPLDERIPDHESWLQCADQALYAAKRAGRNRIHVADATTSQTTLDLG